MSWFVFGVHGMAVVVWQMVSCSVAVVLCGVSSGMYSVVCQVVYTLWCVKWYPVVCQVVPCGATAVPCGMTLVSKWFPEVLFWLLSVKPHLSLDIILLSLYIHVRASIHTCIYYTVYVYTTARYK